MPVIGAYWFLPEFIARVSASRNDCGPSKSGKSLTQVDCLVLCGQLRHHAENRGADLGQFGRDLHRASQLDGQTNADVSTEDATTGKVQALGRGEACATADMAIQSLDNSRSAWIEASRHRFFSRQILLNAMARAATRQSDSATRQRPLELGWSNLRIARFCYRHRRDASLRNGARGRTRTGMAARPRDFKSLASTDFATRAWPATSVTQQGRLLIPAHFRAPE